MGNRDLQDVEYKLQWLLDGQQRTHELLQEIVNLLREIAAPTPQEGGTAPKDE